MEASTGVQEDTQSLESLPVLKMVSWEHDGINTDYNSRELF